MAVGEQQRANEIMDTMTDRAELGLAYYSTHNQALFDQEFQTYLMSLNSIGRAAEEIGDRKRAERAIKLEDPKALAEEVYLSVLTRRPTPAEIADVQQ